MALIARLIAVVVTTLVALAGVLALAGPAHAEPGFKFWAYYHLTNGKWVTSDKGADSVTPEDGDVEGFRYATTTATEFDRPPRAVPTFEDICADTEATQGQKRIGLVIDYGTPQDAAAGDTPPPAEAACAAVPADATAQQALESVKPLRIEGGLMCAIDGYPSSECAPEVKNANVPATEEPVDLMLPAEAEQQSAESSVPWPLVGVGALVLVLGGGAVVLARRRA
jgi:hypothetical protein